MTLPPDFQFSQRSLEDFVACPRRFGLRYIQDVAWPAAVADPPDAHEQHMQRGAAFHQLVHQYLLGVPEARLSHMVAERGDPDLARWWHNYLQHPPAGLPPMHYLETTLSTPLSGRRLVARYDLLAIEPGARAIIVDWKTGRKPKQRGSLAARLQTRVYRYVLVQAGAHLNRRVPFTPEQVTMLYWFADYPESPEYFPYDSAQFEADGEYLSGLINKIDEMQEGDFRLTDEERHCRFCRYRSLCGRGEVAGSFDEFDEDELLDDDFDLGDFEFDQIQEIEF